MKKPAQKQITACQVLLTIHRRLVMIVQIKFHNNIFANGTRTLKFKLVRKLQPPSAYVICVSDLKSKLKNHFRILPQMICKFLQGPIHGIFCFSGLFPVEHFYF